MLAINRTEISDVAGAESPSVSILRLAVNRRLTALLGHPMHSDDRVLAAMRYGVLAPGKRIRPLLMLLTGQALGVHQDDLLDVACAVEMVHAASLFLDDLPCMDDAGLRRGQPTVHIAFGEDVATLGSVALLANAWRLTANAPNLDPAIRLQMVTVLSDAVGLDGLVGGQFRDLHASRSPTVSAAQNINHRKTSVLFEAVFDIACIAARCGPETKRCFKSAAAELGQAFQLLDDLVDMELASHETGKDAHQDDGKSTLVAMLGPKLARQRLKEHIDMANDFLRKAMPSDNAVVSLTNALFAKSGLK